jgi:hypothetical protein
MLFRYQVPKHYHVTKNVRLIAGISNLALFIGKTAADPLNLKAFAILADLSQARGFLSGQPPLHFWSG